MKKFLRVMIIIFSLIIVLISSLTLLVISDIISIEHVVWAFNFLGATKLRVIISFALFIILGLLGIFSIIVSDGLTQDVKGGVVLPLTVGDVHISNQTFENIVLNVAKKYGTLRTNRVAVKMVDTGINVEVFAYVLQDTIISEITEKLQKDIKETVLKQTTVEVSNVNVKIKGVYELAQTKEQ